MKSLADWPTSGPCGFPRLLTERVVLAILKAHIFRPGAQTTPGRQR